MLPILGVLPLLAKVPAAISGIASIFGWGDVEDVADKVDELVSGVGSGAASAPTPEQLAALQGLANTHAQEMAKIDLQKFTAYTTAETQRLTTVNDTMRAEYASGDLYVRRWRPTYGYVVAGAWGLQALAIFVVCVVSVFIADPVRVAAMYAGLQALIAALATQWGVALAVLGVNVSKRSTDKQTATGQKPVGALAKVAALLQK